MTGLTDLEMEVVDDLGQIWNKICRVVGDGPSRDPNLGEAVRHVHALQHMIMAQAAARAHPDRLRLLGELIP